MGKFIVRNGDLEGRKLRLESGAKIVLGRERADMSFFDKRMSRRHCTLEVRDGVDHVRDLGSTNGTWVNNQRITEAELKPGDVLRVGFTELEFLGNPEPTTPVMADGAPLAGINPNQTIAFRAKDLQTPPPKPKARKRLGGKSRLADLKSAAMGKKSGKRQYISAKGKFCEACGEAIFVKEGAPDEGMVVDGLYLCRMCALISEKQKQLGKDGLMMNFAKVVHGERAGGPASGSSTQDSGAPMEIIEEEVSLEDLTGPDEGEETVKVDDGPGTGSASGPEAPPPGAGSAPGTPKEIVEEAVSLDFNGPEPSEKTGGDPAAFGVNSEAPAPAAEAKPDVPTVAPAALQAGGAMEIVEEEVSLEDLTSPDQGREIPAAPPQQASGGGAPVKAIEKETDLGGAISFEGGAEAIKVGDAPDGAAEDGPDVPPPGTGPAPGPPEETVEERGVAEDASPALPPLVADEASVPMDKPEPPAADAISIPDDIRFESEADKPERSENDDIDSGEGDGVA